MSFFSFEMDILLKLNRISGPAFKTKNTPNITYIGKFIKNTYWLIAPFMDYVQGKHEHCWKTSVIRTIIHSPRC